MIKDLIDILKMIKNESKERIELIKLYQSKVWIDNLDYATSEEKEILARLAYDLDFYEPNENLRKIEPTYYGEKRLIIEIDDTLNHLKNSKG